MPVLRSSAPSADLDELLAAGEELGFPLFVKAVAGGGGRGMRRVLEADALRESIEAAMREAESAFGDPTVFLEQAVVYPRHIEVQVLADGAGWRDPPVRARLLGAAPPPEGHRDRPGAQPRPAAARADLRRRGRLRPAHRLPQRGTVEFLLDASGQHVFIEMNPRIQVEHTVTEEVTDVDLVQSQLRIAAGQSLDDLGLRQEDVRLRGAALQCRITTEDPANGFRPDTGIISALPLARRRGHPARRRDLVVRHRDQRPLRLDAGEAVLPRP